MKKLYNFLKEKSYLFAGWFGVTNNWGSDAFSSVDGIVGKVTEVMNIAIYASALVAVLIIVYSGINIIISAGDSERFEGGIKGIENSVIGLIIVFLAATIIKFVVTEFFK